MAISEPVDVPTLVPARMVNEFTYCPRLFFLEWVQGRFVDNADTVAGTSAHRVVDHPSGAAPSAEDADDLKRATSIMVSSPELGVSALIDLLEPGGDGTVVPIEYKKGRPPDIEQRVWEPERVQLCVQGLLLRAEGYECDRGVVWFAETRERVEVPFDEALIARTREVLNDLRSAARSDEAPPPLVDSPKCPRCSLVGLCLPDEHNLLSERVEQRPRRLTPRDRAARPLYVTEPGSMVGKSKGRLVVTKKGERLASERMIDVSQVCLFGNVQVSAQAMRDLLGRDVPVCWFSSGGWFAGMAQGLPSKHVELRRRQVIAEAHGGLDIARRVIDGKIRNSRTLLRRNARSDVTDTLESLTRVTRKVKHADSVDRLLGLEGAAARAYFGAFPSMIDPDRSLPGEAFCFEGRNRRPPTDAVNCLLSYLYSVLVKDLTVACHAVGFDPYLGFYHRPRFGRPALALDLAEEFRPLIAESTVLTLINNGEVTDSDFVVRAAGVTLTKGGRRAVLAAYERRLETEVTHPVFGYKISYRRVLDVQARLLAAHLLGEVPEYTPMVTR